MPRGFNFKWEVLLHSEKGKVGKDSRNSTGGGTEGGSGKRDGVRGRV